MKTKINLILGFLESGKTTIINSNLRGDDLENKNVIIVQDEFGEVELDSKIIKSNKNIHIVENNFDNKISADLLIDIIHKYEPDEIIIEANLMKNIDFINDILINRKLNKISRLTDCACVIDVKTFDMYLNNMYNLVNLQISNSKEVILTNCEDLNKNNLNEIISKINKINKGIPVFKYINYENDSDYVETNYIPLTNNSFSTKGIISVCFIMFLIPVIASFFYSLSNINYDYSGTLYKFYIIFISILIEGIPFILIASLISAVIQICISKEKLTKLFSTNIFLSCIFASFIGIIFPICDCGTIPLVKGFIKKNVPLGTCITFMLAAPIVNPVTIASTYFAFQDMKCVVLYRLSCGIIIAILVGLAVNFFTAKNTNIIIDNNNASKCQCSLCNTDLTTLNNNILNKIMNIFVHTSDEFFSTGMYMILGAFVSSVFQTFISNSIASYIPTDNKSSLIIMMLLAFVLSVCSTSDAFIAKGFLNAFSINSVMGFLIVGPMLDIKNTFMLLGSFDKKFVLRLIFLIILISYNVILIFNIAN